MLHDINFVLFFPTALIFSHRQFIDVKIVGLTCWFTPCSAFSDVPQPPRDVEVKDVFAKHCTIHWKRPAEDGGSEILRYVIEKQDLGKIGMSLLYSPTMAPSFESG